MKKHLRAIIMLLAAGVFLLFWYAPWERTYRGAPLRAWMTKDVGQFGTYDLDDPDTPPNYEEAIRHWPTETVLDEALGMLRKHESWEDRTARYLNEKFKWNLELSGSADRYHEIAGQTFKILGSNAAPAIGELKSLLNDTNCAEAAVASLGYVGTQSKPALLSGLTNQNRMVRIGCMEILANIEVNPTNLIAAVAPFLNDSDIEVSDCALGIISGQTHSPELAVPILIKALNGTNDARYVVNRLGFFGSNAAPALPKLARLAKDSDLQTAYVALASIAKIDPRLASRMIPRYCAQRKTIPWLALHIMARESPGTVEKILLGAIDDAKPEQNFYRGYGEWIVETNFNTGQDLRMPLAVEALSWAPAFGKRQDFRQALDKWYSSTHPSTNSLFADIPTLLVILDIELRLDQLAGDAPNDSGWPQKGSRDSVSKAILQMGNERLADMLVRSAYSLPLFGRSNFVSHAEVAGKVLEPLAPLFKPALPRLREWMDGTNETLATRAMLATSLLGGESMPVFLAGLTNKFPRVRATAAHVFAEPYCRNFPEFRRKAAPLLLALTNDADDGVRRGARKALAEIEPESVAKK